MDSAGVAGRWGDVDAVRIALSVTATAPEVVDDTGAPLTRNAEMTVSLRSRNP